jgi:ferric-dicitrate binding protein FerR (iron transport regulator)
MTNIPDYSDYSVSEFVLDESFRKWVLSPDNVSESFWSEWLDAYPEKRLLTDAAKEIIRAIYIKEPELSRREVDVEIESILSQLESRDTTATRKKGLISFLYKDYWHVGLTACVITLVVLSIVWFVTEPSGERVSYRQVVTSSEDKLIEKINNTSTAKTVLLPDGSRVVLQGNSKISYSTSFNDLSRRKIYLSGTALFEVEKNAAKPFLVYTNGLITKVLGTKFLIKSSESDKKVSVEVVSGIVAVYSYIDKGIYDDSSSKKLNSLILTANQKASYSSEDKTLMASIVENPVIISSSIVDFEFEDTSIDSVFSRIQRAYGISIIYDDKILAKRTFTATLGRESLYEKLDIICKTINASYEVIDGKIVVRRNAD